MEDGSLYCVLRSVQPVLGQHSLSNWKSRAQDHCMVAGHGGATMAQRAEVFIEGFPMEFLVLMGSVESSELHIQWTGVGGGYTGPAGGPLSLV